MITHKQIEKYILKLPNVSLDYPFGKEVAVYKTNEKMFVLIQEGSDPVRLSVKCDPQLAILLREKYETVMPGYHLNKKHWNTVVLTGQLPLEDIHGFILHSYNLIKGNS